MPRTIPALTLALALSLFAGCTSGQAPGDGSWTTLAPAPLPLTQNLLNPGRGFFTTGIDLLHPDEDEFAAVRAQGYTLAYPYETWLPADRDLTEAELATLQRGFDLVRRHGFKLILRFRYSEAGDAEWSRIIRHLEQLLPLIQANADVIAVLQAGFLGRWGEWHCWQASGPCHDGAAEKKYVLDALLGALADAGYDDLPVAVRYPADKARYLGDVIFTGDDDVPPPPEPVGGFAESAGLRGRIAHLNDCFLSSANDVGTYPDVPPERVAQWRAFTYAENAYLVFGGETCEAADRDDPARARGARALAELERAHLDYLNADYHPGMLDRWRQDGIYDEIAARMGYRLVLEEAAWTDPAPGPAWRLKLTVRNDGFSRLKRRYDVVLVLQQGDRTVEQPLGFDLRRVEPGMAVTFEAAGLARPAAGAWRLGVAVRDPAPALARRAEYGIRFANDLDYDGVNWLGTLDVR